MPSTTIRVLTSLFAFCVLVTIATADAVLDVSDPSLTSYLATSSSNVQDIRPLAIQRGVGIDGSARRGSSVIPDLPHAGHGGGAISGAPAGSLNGMSLATGAFGVSNIDLALPAEGGLSWRVGRSYNARQKDSGSSYYASSGYQGENWFQSSQPELVFHEGASDADDVIYLIYAADAYIEFKRAEDGEQQPSTDTFKAVNGAAGAILLDEEASAPDTATFYTQRGYKATFFWIGDADIDDAKEGQFWKIEDPAGNVSHVGDRPGDATSASDALSHGIGSSGEILYAIDSSDRRFTYTYTSGYLTEVKAETKTGGVWGASPTGVTEVGKVEYSYYIAADAHGEDGDLEPVTITTPLTDSGVDLERNKYYWYYEGTYHATTNPGYHHQLQYVIDFEGYRGYDWDQDSTLDDDPLSATEANLKPYASAHFEYDTDRRIVSAWFNGACGCSGASTGEHTFEYETNGSYTDNTGYDTTWATRTIVRKPDVTYVTASGAIQSWITQYFDEVGQPLHRVQTDGDPDDTAPAPETWVTSVTRNSDGQVTDVSSPANVTAYTHSTASITTSTTAGLVNSHARLSSGDLAGLVSHRKWKEGTSGSANLSGTREYTSSSLTVGDVTVVRPFVDSSWVYDDETTTEAGGGSGPSGSHETTYAYTMYTGGAVLMPKKINTTNPAVSTSKNGSGTATTATRYLRKDGTPAFTEAADGIFSYTEFTDGQLVKSIQDAKTNDTGYPSGDDPNTDFGITETGDGWHRETTYSYDAQARRTRTTMPDGRKPSSYWSKLTDGRMIALNYPDYEYQLGDKWYGPASFSVTNHAGRAEAQASVAISSGSTTLAQTSHVDETDSDPILAVASLGSVVRLSTTIYGNTGSTATETRSYFDTPSSLPGTDGTHYDPALVAYDDTGRRTRSKDATGTIRQTVFDALGRGTEQWIGTNDSDFDNGESSGTDDMVKVSSTVYDSGNDGGNSLVTKRTAFVVDGTTDRRDTTFEHDVRGRVLLATNPSAPHTFSKYDNRGRAVAAGQFSSTASIVVGTDDPTTETANRLALGQTFYDEMGRVWKSQRHKIDAADGSDDDNLTSLTWYDEAGRTMKVEGEQLAKTFYDRLGRQTHQFVLAEVDDTAYANADDVSGDIVMAESQTAYESSDSDEVLLRLQLDRFHDDYGGSETTGAMDTNADGDDLDVTAADLEGRPQITAMWYDRLGRVTDTVRYGTNADVDLDRDGLTLPTRSDTKLVASNVYNDDGTLQSVTDPRDLETRFEYDDAGRQVTIIANYVNGTPSSSLGDDDVHTRYVYTDGLRTKLFVDLDGDNLEDSDDQVTEYDYGTTGGGGSASDIATGHLLAETKYPDSTGASDVVSFGYNAQGQLDYKKDQGGGVIDMSYDDSGRKTVDSATTLGTDVDGDIRRIEWSYSDLGRVDLVTQYDAATSGNVTDEVQYTYDGWGNLTTYEQDNNSAVGASGSVDDYEVSYTWAKSATSGNRNTIYRKSVTLPGGERYDFQFSATGGKHDADLRRVSYVEDASRVDMVAYEYLGVGTVVETDYPEPDVFSRLFGTTSGSYDNLDQFNRIATSSWTKDLTTDKDFFHIDLDYDRDSNITVADEVAVHVGFDVEYTMDGLNRLDNAEEGTWSGSAITSQTREQIWTLDQLGNWDGAKLDLNGDTDYTDADEYNDKRTHNTVNELTAQDIDNDSTDDYDLAYEATGNLGDDDHEYQYIYDAWNRLREVKQSPAFGVGSEKLVVEHTYNGLGHRIGEHYDVDGDGTVEDTSDDPWHRFANDERWRIVAMFVADDSDPTEQFLHHWAGASGRGGSSYIDALAKRDRDTDDDGTLEERIYYCQNWRYDVVAIIDDAGQQVEMVRYSAYGVPFGLPAGDADSDGDVDSSDASQVYTWWNSGPYDVRGDLDLDGDVDTNDHSAVVANDGDSLGWEALSLAHVGSAIGLAGSTRPAASPHLHLVRRRAIETDLGRWSTRDSLGYVDSKNLHEYARSNPVNLVDPSGNCVSCGQDGGGIIDDVRGYVPTCEGPCLALSLVEVLDHPNLEDIIDPYVGDCEGIKYPGFGFLPFRITWEDSVKSRCEQALRDYLDFVSSASCGTAFGPGIPELLTPPPMVSPTELDELLPCRCTPIGPGMFGDDDTPAPIITIRFHCRPGEFGEGDCMIPDDLEIHDFKARIRIQVGRCSRRRTYPVYWWQIAQ